MPVAASCTMGQMIDADPLAQIATLCERHAIVATARARTRYELNRDRGGIDDDELLRQLLLHGWQLTRDIAPRGRVISDETLAQELLAEAMRVLRRLLVATLCRDHDLHAVTERACGDAAIGGREAQVAYCLTVLCQKQDRPRSPSGGGPKARRYELDVGAEDFDDRLAAWATTVAGNLRDGAATYAAIHDEAMQSTTTALRSLLPLGARLDDVADVLALKLSRLFTGLALEEMGLEAAREHEPAGNEYVFQLPIRAWARIVAGNEALPPVPVDPDAGARGAEPTVDEPEPGALSDEVFALLIERVRELARTRGVLEHVTARVDELLERADGVAPANARDAALYKRFRAELAAVADDLHRERMRFGPMLAYVLLAPRRAPKRRLMAILSLRSDTLDARVVKHIAGRMRTILDSGAPPSAALVALADQAPRALVPANRAAELDRLRADGAYRTATLADLGRLLDGLPPSVHGLASISALVPGRTSAGSVATTRGQLADELHAVDPIFRRIFGRYAMSCR